MTFRNWLKDKKASAKTIKKYDTIPNIKRVPIGLRAK